MSSCCINWVRRARGPHAHRFLLGLAPLTHAPPTVRPHSRTQSAAQDPQQPSASARVLELPTEGFQAFSCGREDMWKCARLGWGFMSALRLC